MGVITIKKWTSLCFWILSKVILLITLCKDVISRSATMCCWYFDILERTTHSSAHRQQRDSSTLWWWKFLSLISKCEEIFLITNLINQLWSNKNLSQRSIDEIFCQSTQIIRSWNWQWNYESDNGWLCWLAWLLSECRLKENLENILDHIDDDVHKMATNSLNFNSFHAIDPTPKTQ